MTFESALSFFLVIFIFGITPGPGVFAIIGRALVHGAKSCFLLALGMSVSDALYLVAACLGLAVIATQWSEIFTVIRYIGALYLMYLGWLMWRVNMSTELTSTPETGQGKRFSFVQGLLISASNPKVILFYIAFLPTFMNLSSLSSFDILLAATLTVLALMPGLMLIAAFASRARIWFQSERATRILNRTAGSIMFAAGVYLGIQPS